MRCLFTKNQVTSQRLCQLHNEKLISYCEKETCGVIMCKKCSELHEKKEPLHKNKKRDFPPRLDKTLDKYSFLKYLGKTFDSKSFEIAFENKKFGLRWVDVKEGSEKYKIDDPSHQTIDELKEWHQKEIDLLQSYNCEYIMQIYDYEWLSTTNTDLIMIHDHIKSNLKDAYAKKNEVNHDRKVEWFNQIAKAVQYSHKVGIIHRNLKPQHIYVTENNKILLWGFLDAEIDSEEFFNSEDLKDQIQGQFSGTPDYMAPEIKDKENPTFTKATDIWALGIIYHMMLATDNPFKKNNLTLKIRRLEDRLLVGKYSFFFNYLKKLKKP